MAVVAVILWMEEVGEARACTEDIADWIVAAAAIVVVVVVATTAVDVMLW